MTIQENMNPKNGKMLILLVTLALSLVGNFFQYVSRYIDIQTQESCGKFRDTLQHELDSIKMNIITLQRLEELSQSPKWNDIPQGQEAKEKALGQIKSRLETYRTRRDQLEDKIIETYILFSSK